MILKTPVNRDQVGKVVYLRAVAEGYKLGEGVFEPLVVEGGNSLLR